VTTTERRLPVIEMFGPTLQGEGRVIGLKTMFVRLAGCDYA
jgi:7-carboxy-7-deazaguanine synthase